MLIVPEACLINNSVHIMNNNTNMAIADLDCFSAHKSSYQQFRRYNNINIYYLINNCYSKED